MNRHVVDGAGADNNGCDVRLFITESVGFDNSDEEGFDDCIFVGIAGVVAEVVAVVVVFVVTLELAFVVANDS